MRLIAVLMLLLAGLVATGSARAGVVRAENVLPPGQSGYVSITGLPSGSGSPHLYDQTELFVNFERKPFDFGQPGEKETPFPGVEIVRGAYGVPIVTGETELDAWKGAGYAVAQDRMFQLEAFRHATQGRLADLVGEGALDDDLVARRDFYTAEERREQFERLPTALRARIEAYRDGINVWVEHLQENPQDVPAEYPATATEVTPWTTDDTLSVGVFLARTVPSGDGAELDNLAAIQQSGSPRVLDRLLPLRIRGQRSTIPRSEGLFPQGRARTPAQERAARRRSLRFAASLPEAEEQRGAALPAGRIGRVGGSLMFAVRKRGGKGSLLFNGPQLGYSIPELFVELEVHASGLDVRGVTAAGAPVIAIGHNGHVAWGITSGLSDDDDLYAEELVPGEPEKYRFKGEVREMDCRTETFTYSGPPSDVLGGTIPGSGSREERVCRTVHGPVQVRQGDVAYTRRYAIWGRELETLEGLAAVNTARDIRDVGRAARKLTWNGNLMAADSQGNIGYWHPGLRQRRPPQWDERLPLPGTGEAEWPGLVPRSQLPSVSTRARATSSTGTTSRRRAGPRATDRRPSASAGPSIACAGSTAWSAASAARRPSRPPRRPSAARAPSPSSGRSPPACSGACGAARRGRRAPSCARCCAGTGTTTARTTRAPCIPVSPPGSASRSSRPGAPCARSARARGGSARGPGLSHVFDITAKEAYALRTLPPAALRRVAGATFRSLAAEFRSNDPRRWRAPRAMYDVQAQGAGSPPELPFFDRGTYEQIVELAP